jgi:hypothetical protein
LWVIRRFSGLAQGSLVPKNPPPRHLEGDAEQ